MIDITAYRCFSGRNYEIMKKVLLGQKLSIVCKEYNLTAPMIKRITVMRCLFILRCTIGYNNSFYNDMRCGASNNLKWLREHKRLFIDPFEFTITKEQLNNLSCLEETLKT